MPPETERQRVRPGPTPKEGKPKLEPKLKRESGKSYTLHFEIDIKKLLKGKGEWANKYVKISGKLVAEVSASPADETAKGYIATEKSNEGVSRSLELKGTWEEQDLDSPLFKSIAPIEVDLKILTLEGPKLKLNAGDARFDIVKFGLSSEVEVSFGDLGVLGLAIDWVDLEYEKDEYKAKVINAEFKAGVHHVFKAVDLGPVGKWDLDATFTPTLEIEPNWKGWLARGAKSIEELAERLSTELLTVANLGVAVEFLTVAGSVGICVLAFVQASDTTGYEAAHLDKRRDEVLDRMTDGFVAALSSENPDDFPEKGTPEYVGFDAGRRYRADWVASVRATRTPGYSESAQNEDAEINATVAKLLDDNLWKIKPDAYEQLKRPAGEFVFRAFGEKHRPTFMNKLSANASSFAILVGAWASCFDGETPHGPKAKEMLKQYLPPSEASTVDADIASE